MFVYLALQSTQIFVFLNQTTPIWSKFDKTTYYISIFLQVKLYIFEMLANIHNLLTVDCTNYCNIVKMFLEGKKFWKLQSPLVIVDLLIVDSFVIVDRFSRPNVNFSMYFSRNSGFSCYSGQFATDGRIHYYERRL